MDPHATRSPAPPPRPPGRPPRRALAAALVVLLAGVVVGVLARRGARAPQGRGDSPPPDPRLSYAGPFLNVRPGVGYVGDSACADCHVEKAQSYARHPMGRSLSPVRDLPGPPDASFTALGSSFRVERRAGKVWHRQTRLDAEGRPVYEQEFTVDYVIGSGTRGYSYLTDRDGYLFQTPVSWFSQKGVWDLSPHFTPELLRGRPVPPDCLFCHANRARAREGTENGYERPTFEGYGIGCERCHGPGALHVKERTRDLAVEGGVDYTIVNPGRLAPKLREAVCQQCHLVGEARVVRRGRGLYDFRPGLPLEDFVAVFVRDRGPGAGPKAVNHVEQVAQSKCFRGSAGTDRPLGCVSCHDPHEAVPRERRADFYRGRCLECHRSQGCRVPRGDRLRQSPDDSCVDCHMPRYPASDIAHTAATDHRIIRDKGKDETEAPARPGPEPGILPFYRRGADADPDAERDLGVALARLATGGKGDPRAYARRAVDLLGDGLGSFPEDVPAREARGQALAVLGRGEEALGAFESALARAPRRERSLVGAARLAQDGGDLDKALTYWRRAVEVDPWAADYRANLARLLAHAGQWDEARGQGEAWLRLDPESVEARKFRVRCLLRQGDRKAADAEWDRLRRLR